MMLNLPVSRAAGARKGGFGRNIRPAVRSFHIRGSAIENVWRLARRNAPAAIFRATAR